jgi:transketolase domain protein
MKDNKNLLNIRKEIFLTGYSASMAHLASAYSIVELIYVLYEKNILKYDATNPKKEDRDIFILSKGHGSLALYVTLQRCGFFDKAFLRSFAKKGSHLGGEPTIPDVAGIEATTGSLGHGLSIATGIAMAKKIDKKNEKVYVLLGDGELEEGTVWEAVMFAVHQNLSNLVIIVDNNKIQKMSTIENVMSIKDWGSKFKSFGCNVKEIDGHNVEEIENTFKTLDKEKLNVIIANTVKGKGLSLMENDPRWHWRLPSKKELKTFVSELEISEEELEECKKHI